MDNLMLFESNEFGTVRVIELNGEPWFVGKDIAEKLGYSNSSKAVNVHVDKDDKIFEMLSHTQNGNVVKTQTALINESGLYSLILRSKLESAKKFKKWVTNEVLPSIRKHGAYMTEDTLEKALTSPDFLIQLATKLKEEQEARKALENQIERQAPLVDFANQIGSSNDCIDVGEMAKLLSKNGITIGRNKLFQWLRSNGILMIDNTPYQSYIDRGYFKVVEYTKRISNIDNICLKTLITGKGQIWLTNKFMNEEL